MGTYLNPGNEGFRKILQSEYVDKTGLLALINKTVGTMGMLTCISRPRRFGKFYAAKMNMPLSHVPNMIVDAVYRELTESYPELDGKSLTDAMISCVEKTDKEFVFIIDEWDSLIREAKNDTEVQKKYLHLLRGWFKNNNFTPRVVALCD